VLLNLTADYVETNSTTVTLTTGATAGDVLTFITPVGVWVSTTSVPASIVTLTPSTYNSGTSVQTALTNVGSATGATNVGYTASGAGAVPRTVASKQGESVSVEDFGAVGNGIADDTLAIQAALNTGKDVIFNNNSYVISASLSVNSQRLTGLGYTGSFRQSTILPTGNFPAFVPVSGSFTSFVIDGFFINYGSTMPSVSTGNSNKIGFYITGSTFPQYAEIRNCSVQGAWYAYYDNAGTYQSVLYKVRATKCMTGFSKSSGTTIEFNTCSAANGLQGFNIQNVLAPLLINCACDFMAVSTTSPNTAANYFYQCPGITIRGWDGESNTMTGNFASYMTFNLCVGSISGFSGYQNTLAGTTSTDIVPFFYITNNSRMTFDGVRVPGLTTSDLVFSGTSGNPYTLYADTYGIATLISSIMNAAINGTPTVRYSVAAASTASVFNISCYTDNVTLGVLAAVASPSPTAVVASSFNTSTSGTVALVAGTPVTVCSVSGIGTYIVNVYANYGGATQYQSSSLVINDGSFQSITSLKAGASQVLSLSGTNVQATCTGTTTGTYSLIKIA
jgi:hypothetical protein